MSVEVPFQGALLKIGRDLRKTSEFKTLMEIHEKMLQLLKMHAEADDQNDMEIYGDARRRFFADPCDKEAWDVLESFGSDVSEIQRRSEARRKLIEEAAYALNRKIIAPMRTLKLREAAMLEEKRKEIINDFRARAAEIGANEDDVVGKAAFQFHNLIRLTRTAWEPFNCIPSGFPIGIDTALGHHYFA